MAEIHDIIREKGRAAARQLMAQDPHGRTLVEIASMMLSDEQQALGFTHSGFAITALPHHDPGPDVIYSHRVGHMRLQIEPGAIASADEIRRVGVPYGTRARLILLYLQTMAVKAKSQDIELGASLRSWMLSMGLKAAGSDYRAIREQAMRISLCKLTLAWRDNGNEGLSQEMIVSHAINLAGVSDDDRQGSLWTPKVRLTDGFFQQLLKHPVPFHEAAVKALVRHRLALDLYIWLCYRTHNMKQEARISWAALHAQFGAGYNSVPHFKPRFIAALKLALAAREENEADVDIKTGVILRSLRPTVVTLPGKRPLRA
jgi:hypothetical protein